VDDIDQLTDEYEVGMSLTPESRVRDDAGHMCVLTKNSEGVPRMCSDCYDS